MNINKIAMDECTGDSSHVMEITENGMSTNSKFENSLIASGMPRVMRTAPIFSLSKRPLFRRKFPTVACTDRMSEICYPSMFATEEYRCEWKIISRFQSARADGLCARWKQMIIQFVVNSRAKQMLLFVVPSKPITSTNFELGKPFVCHQSNKYKQQNSVWTWHVRWTFLRSFFVQYDANIKWKRREDKEISIRNFNC